MFVTICGRFRPNEGAVMGYGNRIQAKYNACLLYTSNLSAPSKNRYRRFRRSSSNREAQVSFASMRKASVSE